MKVTKVGCVQLGKYTIAAVSKVAQDTLVQAALLAKKSGGVITGEIEKLLHHAMCFELRDANRGLTFRPVQGECTSN